ncbi:MAG: hypothetical protein HN817_03665 [Porticoccaceae bacterium]|jgi:hypothetical protein|nr:hypothetical protein [Porticoccaceae bacterium]
MKNENNLQLGDDFIEDDSASAPTQPREVMSSETRRRLEARLDAVRLRKQTEDYNFDLD